ncbi:DUF998 domain-containing protein [Pseudonocardia sp. TRM90224]|uniref:DUF998 domain-containing protein n=1 Tax=Pseudonocardia sp. TRM90224 TaxID=2812678 RepID=UPI001E59AF4B|nr:DUF998 domain-containing protein [Pseudonocardia sp. TRM90224]
MTMTGGTGQEPERLWPAGAFALAGVLVALVPMAALHVIGDGVVDPLWHPISDYVVVGGGYALLAWAAFALAASCLLLSTGLRISGLPRPQTPARVLISAAAALVAVAVFPTHLPGTTAGIVSNIHRAAGGWVFVALPLACWMVARRAREVPVWKAMAPVLSWASGTAGILSAVFLLSYVPIVIAGSSGIPLLGGVERVLYAAVMVGLFATIRATRLAVEGARSSSGEVAQGATPAEFGQAA